MFDQVKIYSPSSGQRCILLPRGAQPTFPGVYDEVPPERAVRVVLDAIVGRYGGPDWKLLHALGIRQHPANLSSRALEGLIVRAFRGIPRWQLLREVERRPLSVIKPVPLPKSSGPVERAEPRAYVGVEVISEEGKPVQGVRIEFTLPDGSVRSMATDEQGRALATAIDPGTCGIALPALDASRWRPSGGSHAVIRTEPTLRHIVQQGECLSQIAHQYGLGGWDKVWNHSENSELKKKRKSPHVLLPGDEVRLPGIEIAQIERPNDAMHRIVVNVKALEVELVLTLKDSDGEPLKDEPYELTFRHPGKDEKRAGSLDGAGQLHEQLPVTVRSALLSLSGRGLQRRLELGRLDPVDDEGVTPVETGAYSRLRSLGYIARATEEGPLSDRRAAVRAFQRLVMGRSDPTGELDAETCSKIAEVYGV